MTDIFTGKALACGQCGDTDGVLTYWVYRRDESLVGIMRLCANHADTLSRKGYQLKARM